jgi:hypothetical protein
MITEMMDEKEGHAEDEAEHIKQHRCGFDWVIVDWFLFVD